MSDVLQYIQTRSMKMKIIKTLRERPMNLTEITQKIIVKRSTIRARLCELKENGYVIKQTPDADGKWALTEPAIQLLSKDKIDLKLPTEKQK